MKKLLFIIFPLLSLSSCFEEVDTTLSRDIFIGNYDFELMCVGDPQAQNYIIFIEKPIGSSDSLTAVVIIRNLLNQNNTIQAVISQNDLILNDSKVNGTGTLNTDTHEINLSLSFGGNDCSGKGTLRL